MKGALTNNQKIKSVFGKYQNPSRIENEANIIKIRAIASTINIISCLLKRDRFTSLFSKRYKLYFINFNVKLLAFLSLS